MTKPLLQRRLRLQRGKPLSVSDLLAKVVELLADRLEVAGRKVGNRIPTGRILLGERRLECPIEKDVLSRRF